ncbi:VOC family protein [Paracoccus sp. M683]|uniref:VOC family protein n=1 Tax=Paracoccus sp. M683 TaxID=2594268 RepID=UPI00117D0853|nr:VOC family protein [Paracoccus sp. M683]TRW95736.1 VOC family protein [Paracoccus sp. M683]
MAAPALDHIVVAAESLDAGTDWLTARLGVSPLPGGKHPMMGTHNALWHLGGREYLELIAIDPDAPAPTRPRWFGLNRFSGPPRLVAWVARAHPLTAPQGSSVTEASRGDLRWRIAIPGSGVSAADGLAPLLIDWGHGPHPTDTMPDQGLSLTALTLTHPALPALALDDPRISTAIGPAHLSARLSTPLGEITL